MIYLFPDNWIRQSKVEGERAAQRLLDAIKSCLK